MSPAGFNHGAVIMNVALPVGNFVKPRKLGVVVAAETGFVIARDPDTVRAADMGFVKQERIPSSGPPIKFWPGAPDLALEVISPWDTVYEVDEKVHEWLEAGTLLVWVVNPKQRTVAVHRPGVSVTILTERDILDGGDVLPGFRLPVADIFGDCS